MRCQTGALSDVADSVKMISQSFEDLKATWAKSGMSNEQVLAAIESTKQLSMYASLHE